MKITIDVDITNCTDCFFKKSNRGHGECWEYCSHPNHNQGAYKNILWGCQGKFVTTPEWCPIFNK